eukprot:maker-scaffold630_size122347-snap-gene-0.10 protein:Tk08027 transcript:maker-scaffold630_size122347-snap-gene-0.10-mRNA-1 annotation:"esterase"
MRAPEVIEPVRKFVDEDKRVTVRAKRSVPTMYEIFGSVGPGWEPIRAQFEQHFKDGAEEHAQVCIYHKGVKVVDLWGVSNEAAFDGNSLTVCYSATKTVAAIAMAWLVDQGLMQYSDLVIKHWPEFGQNGKEGIKVEDVLRHESGLQWFSKTVDEEGLQREGLKANRMGELIEAEPLKPIPSKTLDTPRSYHAVTRGWILNEIFRRVHPDHKTIGEFVQEEIHEKYGIDCHIGNPDTSVQDRFFPGQVRSVWWVLSQALNPLCKSVLIGPWSLFAFVMAFASASSDVKKPKTLKSLGDGKAIGHFITAFNAPAVRLAEIPSCNGLCSARGFAKLAAIIANGGALDSEPRLLQSATVDQMNGNGIVRPDAGLFGSKTCFTQGGVNHYRKDEDEPGAKAMGMIPREDYFGWMGLGGSVFQYQPQLNIGFGYVPTLLHWEDFGCGRAARMQAMAVEIAKALK